MRSTSNDIDILHSRRILIVEDEYFIANDLWRSFSASGADVVGPIATARGAIDLLESGLAIDGAVLDINLNGRMAYDVANLLLAKHVPFVFATGYDPEVIPARYAEVRRCEKPVDPSVVARALDSAWCGAPPGTATARPAQRETNKG